MSRLYRLAALGLGILLLAAPAAWACGEGGGMSAGCPMAESMGDSMCHGDERASMDCCASGVAPERLQAWSFDSAKRVPALEATELRPAPAAPFEPSAPRAGELTRFHERGRYTLFSSFLL